MRKRFPLVLALLVILLLQGWQFPIHLFQRRQPEKCFSHPVYNLNAVYTVAFTPDGKHFATGGGNPMIWDVASGEKQAVLEGHECPIYSLAYSPDGRMLAVAGWGNKLTIWDVAIRRPRTTLTVEEGSVYSVAFSPDGALLACGSHDHKVYVWDWQVGRLIYAFNHGNVVRSVAFSPGGRTLASGDYDEVVNLWDLTCGQKRFTLKGRGIVRALVFAPNGGTLISGDNDHSLNFWEVATGKLRASYKTRSGSINALAMTRGGKTLAVGCGEPSEIFERPGRVEIWDLGAKERKTSFVAHDRFVTSVAFSPDGKKLVSGSYDGVVTMWKLPGGQ